jgi:hypothetical protein
MSLIALIIMSGAGFRNLKISVLTKSGQFLVRSRASEKYGQLCKSEISLGGYFTATFPHYPVFSGHRQAKKSGQFMVRTHFHKTLKFSRF